MGDLLMFEEFAINFKLLPLRVRLEKGILYYRRLECSYEGRKQAAKLLGVLTKLLLKVAKKSPEYALTQIGVIAYSGEHGREKHDYLFNPLTENPDDFLQFSRYVYEYRPGLLLPALRRCLQKFRSDRRLQIEGGSCNNTELYLPSEAHIRVISKELFLMLDSLDAREAQYTCKNLIVNAYFDETWYPQLFVKLWRIEKDKQVRDSESIKSYYLIVLNSSTDTELWREARLNITEWLNSYHLLPQKVDFNRHFMFDAKAEYDIFQHTILLLKLINDAYHPVYFYTRNHDLPVPDDNLAIEMKKAYWSMATWLEKGNMPLVLQVLLAGVEPGHFPTSLTQDVASESAQRFLILFDKYLNTNIEDAAKLMGCMIDYSRYTGYKKSFGRLLNEIYPNLMNVRPDLAKIILENAQQNNGSHSSCWNPMLSSIKKS